MKIAQVENVKPVKTARSFVALRCCVHSLRIFKQGERIYAVITKHPTNHRLQIKSGVFRFSELVVSIHVSIASHLGAFTSETRRSERLNIKQVQSPGYFSAKLAQGISAELENEAEERARGPRCRSRGRESSLGKEMERLREVRDIAAEKSAVARNGGKQDRNPGGGKDEERQRETDRRTGRERKGERYGWMGRQRRFQ